MSGEMPQPETAAIVACTISRDVQNFDLLIEDMETALGEAWGDLGFGEAMAFIRIDDIGHFHPGRLHFLDHCIRLVLRHA